MEGALKVENQIDTKIIRFYTPQHNNSFIRQLFSYFFFFFSSLMTAYSEKKNFDCVFATSSRLGTGILGYVISKVFAASLYLDIRDIFSDSIRSLKLFNGNIGKLLESLLKRVEVIIMKHATWLNFVSPGFVTYDHIKKLNLSTKMFTNGIDDIFIQNNTLDKSPAYKKNKIKIMYAGNIGLGQGLELVVIPLAKYFKDKVEFQLIGDGSSVNLIKTGISKYKLKNIKLYSPVDRIVLIEFYKKSDVLLIHLNDIKAFKNVLPSKIFEYGSFSKPIIAGVSGVAKIFLKKNLPKTFLSEPGDTKQMIKHIDHLINHGIPIIENKHFVTKYSRRTIMGNMVNSMLKKFLSIKKNKNNG